MMEDGLVIFCRGMLASATLSELGRRALKELGLDPDTLDVAALPEAEALALAVDCLALAVAEWQATM